MIGIGWIVFSLFRSVLVGFTGIGDSAENPLNDPEFVFLEVIQELLNPELPGFILSALAIYVFSITDDPPSQTIKKKFESIE